MIRKAALCLLFVSSCAVAQETADQLKWKHAYVDTGNRCDPSYSLYPIELKCIKGILYQVRYKITYRFRGTLKIAYLDYIPEKDAPLDANGDIIPRDHSVKAYH